MVSSPSLMIASSNPAVKAKLQDPALMAGLVSSLVPQAVQPIIAPQPGLNV
jgi:hypothetical protein